jgi:hypothetical protein
LRLGERPGGTLTIADPQQRLPEVEVAESRLVGAAAQARIGENALPFEARRRAGPGGLQLQRRQHRPAALRQSPGRVAVMTELRRAERPLQRALGHRKMALGLGVPAQPEQHVAGLAGPVERQIGAHGTVQPAFVMGPRGLDALQELPVVGQRLARAAGALGAVGALSGVQDLDPGRHQAPAASSTISSARRRLSALRASDAAVTTWLLCSRGR